jgi:serine 3-dehydrogenase
MLKEQIVLITGASAGIGEACARTFAREGCRLILAARRLENLQALAATLEAEHGTACYLLELDVRDRDAVNAALAGLPAAWAEIDILINNAGLSRGLDKVQEALHTDWEEMIDTNVKGLLWVSRAVMPGMVARDRGHVINIGSIAGRQVYPGGNVYCATKYAVRAITQGMRIDLVGTKVRCSSVDPGMVETEFSEVRFHGDKERAEKTYQFFPPLKAEDVADTVLFCASRPPHVNIHEVLIMPQDQAAVYASHPRGIGKGL